MSKMYLKVCHLQHCSLFSGEGEMERGGRSVDGWFVQWTAWLRVNPGRLQLVWPRDVVVV